MLRVKNATTAATIAAGMRGLTPASVPAADGASTIGSTRAVSIAAGTNLNARARSGGISRLAKNAMNDTRDR